MKVNFREIVAEERRKNQRGLVLVEMTALILSQTTNFGLFQTERD